MYTNTHTHRFYNYHHTPFASDLKDIAEFEISFDLGQPFKPFQQLLGVLPIASRKLLPGVYERERECVCVCVYCT
jgi:5'-3' exonuclease